MVGASESQVIAEQRSIADDTAFVLNVMKGRLGQGVVESVFSEFGYEVYPFGYESYLSNIIKHMQRGPANSAVRKTRTTPDILVYDRELNQGFFVEIKSTMSPDESKVWLQKSQVHLYRKHWPEATLLVCCLRTLTLYCQDTTNVPWDSLPVDRLPGKEQDCYVVDLPNTFMSLTQKFRLIERNRYDDFMTRIRAICHDFASEYMPPSST
jgi:hypothetical protein